MEKALDSFKSRLLSIKNVDEIPTREPTPEPPTEPEVTTEPAEATLTKHKKSKLKMQQEL